MESKYKYYYNYFQMLNKSIIRKNGFHLFLSIINELIILIKIMNIYQANYNMHLDKIYVELSPALHLRKFSMILRILPVLIYLIIVYLISILSFLYGNKQKINKFEIIIINIF